jgi:PKD domain
MPRLTRTPTRPRRLAGALMLVVGITAVFAAPVRSSVTVPIPADPPPAPPPILAMPPAGPDSPPMSVVWDPITPEAACGGWEVQNAYGGLWPTDNAWWEYSCEYTFGPCIDVLACNADQHSGDRTTYRDHFVWNGSEGAFYGEFFSQYVWVDFGGLYACDLWWDQTAVQWYVIGGLTCPGDSMPSPAPTATPAPTPAPTSPPNQPPTAAIQVRCDGLSCAYDGTASSDPEGTQLTYAWSFGDGSVSSAASGVHTYQPYGPYSLLLGVTDGGGATALDSRSVSLILLQGNGAKVRGVSRVYLSWSGAGSTSFVVSRDGVAIATVPTNGYVDELGKGRTGTYRYRVCEQLTAICSVTVAVTVQ